MSGLAPKLQERVGWNRPTSSTAVAARTWNSYSGDCMRPQIVALILRLGLLAVAGFMFLFLWYGTGADRSPVGLMIGLTVAALVGLWWAELQIQKSLKAAKGEE